MIENITAWDFSVLNFIRDNIANPVLDMIMTVITHSGDFGAVWIAVTILCLCFKKTRPAGVAMALALLLGVIIGNGIIKNIVARPRPFDVNTAIELIISKPGEFSFPSGHTLASFAAAGALFIHHRRLGTAALIYAVLIGFSRLYLYVHYPTDVICGALLGIAIAVIAALSVKKLYEPVSAKFGRLIKKGNG